LKDKFKRNEFHLQKREDLIVQYERILKEIHQDTIVPEYIKTKIKDLLDLTDLRHRQEGSVPAMRDE